MASFVIGVLAVYPKLGWTPWVNSTLAFLIIAWVFGTASMAFLSYLNKKGVKDLHQWLRKLLVFQSINMVLVAIAAMVTAQWGYIPFAIVLIGYFGMLRFQLKALKNGK